MLGIPFEAFYETFKNAYKTWGADLSEIGFWMTWLPKTFSDTCPFLGWSSGKIKKTFERIGIPEAERAYLAGASAQHESEVITAKEGRVPEIGDYLTDMILPLLNTQTCLNNTWLSYTTDW